MRYPTVTADTTSRGPSRPALDEGTCKQPRLLPPPRPDRKAAVPTGEIVAEEFLGGLEVEHELRRPAFVLMQHVGRQIAPLEVRVPERARADPDPDLPPVRVPAFGVRRWTRGMTPRCVEEASQLLAKRVLARRRIRLPRKGPRPRRLVARAPEELRDDPR